MRHQEKKKV